MPRVQFGIKTPATGGTARRLPAIQKHNGRSRSLCQPAQQTLSESGRSWTPSENLVTGYVLNPGPSSPAQTLQARRQTTASQDAEGHFLNRPAEEISQVSRSSVQILIRILASPRACLDSIVPAELQAAKRPPGARVPSPSAPPQPAPSQVIPVGRRLRGFLDALLQQRQGGLMQALLVLDPPQGIRRVHQLRSELARLLGQRQGLVQVASGRGVRRRQVVRCPGRNSGRSPAPARSASALRPARPFRSGREPRSRWSEKSAVPV